MVNQAILTRDAPLADVLFGVDNTFLSRALEAGIFEPYRSPLLEQVPAELQLDPEGG
jgi:thiamine transport system substrate-binding protein